MPADLRLIEGQYLRDLLDQPGALEDTLAALDRPKPLMDLAQRLRRGEFQRIVLTGMGSSYHGLHPLHLELIGQGFTSMMVETSELVHYQVRLLDAKTLVVAVSQSGQSAETVRLLEVNGGRAEVIAVTNTPESPLAKHARAAVITRAGREFSVSCKTYVTTLMALQWLGDILCERDAEQSRRDLKSAAPTASEYLAEWKEHVSAIADRLRTIRHLFLVGRGASLAAVGAGALVIKESDHYHAEGMSSAAFRHGPVEMLSAETLVVVFSGDEKSRELNQRLLADIRQGSGLGELVGESSSLKSFRIADHGESVRPILEILPVQMITIALAALAKREAGKFDRATKITATE
ncbi:MAG TPA: SIS domain-containing protein [Candidatus Dormibacteraeota bacterium]|nr:SIS domain-containing protein [Candidatus Dormibacteraeota bacterium]